MVRNTFAALVAAISLAAIAAPAYADPNLVNFDTTEDSSSVFDGDTPEMREFLANAVRNRLREQGINATAVEEWGGLIRAFVTYEDGRQGMMLFEPGSLRPVRR